MVPSQWVFGIHMSGLGTSPLRTPLSYCTKLFQFFQEIKMLMTVRFSVFNSCTLSMGRQHITSCLIFPSVILHPLGCKFYLMLAKRTKVTIFSLCGFFHAPKKTAFAFSRRGTNLLVTCFESCHQLQVKASWLYISLRKGESFSRVPNWVQTESGSPCPLLLWGTKCNWMKSWVSVFNLFLFMRDNTLCSCF